MEQENYDMPKMSFWGWIGFMVYILLCTPPGWIGLLCTAALVMAIRG